MEGLRRPLTSTSTVSLVQAHTTLANRCVELPTPEDVVWIPEAVEDKIVLNLGRRIAAAAGHRNEVLMRHAGTA
jgi:hypothetical protein